MRSSRKGYKNVSEKQTNKKKQNSLIFHQLDGVYFLMWDIIVSETMLEIQISAEESTYCLNLKAPCVLKRLARLDYLEFTKVPFRQWVFWWYSILYILRGCWQQEVVHEEKYLRMTISQLHAYYFKVNIQFQLEHDRRVWIILLVWLVDWLVHCVFCFIFIFNQKYWCTKIKLWRKTFENKFCRKVP